MTILQKMLLVPVLSLLLYSSFAYYSYTQQQQSSDTIKLLRDQYSPLLSLAAENRQLFDSLRATFKDAVVAVEPSWLTQAATIKQNIDANLVSISGYDAILIETELAPVHQYLNDYYSHAEQLASGLILQKLALDQQYVLVEKVEKFHNQAEQELINLDANIQQHFGQTLNETLGQMNRLQVIGSAVSIGLLLFLMIITFVVSYSTYLQVRQVIFRMRDLALGNSDFSQRLERSQRDELSYLVYWFNKLSDKLEQSYKQLENVSITDKLTGLNNRHRTDNYLPEAMDSAREQGHCLAAALLDIDHFKKINDQHGHHSGDLVLRQVSNILKQQATEHTFIGRWGGEEFIIVLQPKDANEAFSQLDTMRRAIADFEFSLVGKVTASIGVTILTPADTPQSLINRADEHLYTAKHNGRNQVVAD